MVEFIGEVEDGLDCSGACSKPLFGVTRSIADGPVEKDCVTALIDTLDTLVAPAVVCLLTFFILIFSCIGGCWLCCGNDDKTDDMMYDDRGVHGQTIEMKNQGMVRIA